MAYYSATEAKNKFGVLLNTVQREPVFIEKNGSKIAAMISESEYLRLLEIENSLLALQAKEAKKKGFLSEEKSESLLTEMLNAKD